MTTEIEKGEDCIKLLKDSLYAFTIIAENDWEKWCNRFVIEAPYTSDDERYKRASPFAAEMILRIKAKLEILEEFDPNYY